MNFCCIFIIFFLSLLISSSKGDGGKKFRKDYTYDNTINGWLKFHTIALNFEQARLKCFYEGGILASPTTPEMKQAMINAMKTGEAKLIVTGLHAIFPGLFKTIDGVKLEEFPHQFAEGKLKNLKGEGYCISMTESGILYDISCARILQYICFVSDEKIADQSIGPCGTIDKGYQLDATTGHCYKFHGNGQHWTGAYMACHAELGYLAIINSDEEANALANLVKLNENAITKDYIAIGFRDWSQHGRFMTIDGKTLDAAGYAKWASEQPDKIDEFCGAMTRDGLLADISCNETYPFICEIEPEDYQMEEKISLRASHPSKIQTTETLHANLSDQRGQYYDEDEYTSSYSETSSVEEENSK